MHTSRKAAAGLALLTGALLMPALHAQTLALGQYNNTSLSGTATLSSAGTSAAGAFSYDAAGTSIPLAAQTSYLQWETDGASQATVIGGTVTNLLIYGTSTATISGGKIGVRENGSTLGGLSAFGATSVSISGGSVGYLDTFGTSATTVNGGIINEITTYDASTTTINGGHINGFVNANGSSAVRVTGGSIGGRLITDYGGQATVTGGSIGGVYTYSGSQATVSGGNVGGVETDGGTALIQGGNVTQVSALSGTATISGGHISNLFTFDISTSVLDILGTGLTETQDMLSPYSNVYFVTGALQNGDLLSANYIDQGGTLEFNGQAAVPVPEASSVASLGVLLALGLGGVAVSMRRRPHSSRARRKPRLP